MEFPNQDIEESPQEIEAKSHSKGGKNWWDGENPKSKKKNRNISKETEDLSDSSFDESFGTKKITYLTSVHAIPGWTIGVNILAVLLLVCTIIQNDGFCSFTENPMYGASKDTLLLLGAKYGPLIQEGEIYRVMTAIFLNPGLIALVPIFVETIFTFRLEKQKGFWFAFCVFCFSGGYGYILSSLLIPMIVSSGTTGAFCGFIGSELITLILSWSAIGQKDQIRQLIIFLVIIIVLIGCGLSPFFDNFTHIGGLIMGVLFGLMYINTEGSSSFQMWFKLIISFCSFPIISVVFMVCLVVLFRRVDINNSWCPGCVKFSCVNMGNDWCPNIANITFQPKTVEWPYK